MREVVEASRAFDAELNGNETAYQNNKQAIAVGAEDILRAQIYGLLSRVLALPMSDATLLIIRGLANSDASTDIGKALKGLGQLATRSPRAIAEEEYSHLFYGMGSGGELHPYASYYLTGFVYEKPLSDLRKDLVELGIEPSKLSDEPEDHIAFLMEIMHGLITGSLGGGVDKARQQGFYIRHIAPWAKLFFVDLEKAESAKIYMLVGTLGKLFMDLENDTFEMDAA
jgi:TorA maturation chaperone TorD